MLMILSKSMDLDTLYSKALINLNIDNEKTSIYKVNNSIKRVCIMPGSGKSDVDYVIKNKFDLYITSDLSHNDILDLVDSNISYINLTHYGLEKVFVDFMSRYLSKFYNKNKIYKYFSNM